MTLTVIGNKEYALLGRLFFRRNPQAAQDLLSDFRNMQASALLTDVSLLPSLFNQYCTALEKEPGDIRNAKHNREMMSSKKVFVGAVISLYCPGAFDDPGLIRQSQMGIVCGIGQVLGVHHSNVTKMVHEVIHYMKVYDSFRQEVVDIAERLSAIAVKGGDHD